MSTENLPVDSARLSYPRQEQFHWGRWVSILIGVGLREKRRWNKLGAVSIGKFLK